MATTEFDAAQATLDLLEKSDEDLILTALLTGDLVLAEAGDDRQRNFASMSKAATMAGLVRWAPAETLSKVFNEVYDMQPPLTLIRGGILSGIVLIIVGLLIGPGGVSIFK